MVVNTCTIKKLVRLYTKKELLRLSTAYDVDYASRWNKEKLASELSSAISRSENNYQVISHYTEELVQNEDAARIVMRIRRA